MIRPASAIPSPLSRPMLSRILFRERCPTMIAGRTVRNQNGKIERIPRMRLVTALPSVWAAPTWGRAGDASCHDVAGARAGAAADAGIAGDGVAETTAPHFGHAAALSAIDAPHLKQNIRFLLGKLSAWTVTQRRGKVNGPIVQ